MSPARLMVAGVAAGVVVAISVPAVAYWTASGSTTVDASSARLGAPLADVTVEGRSVSVSARPATGGPAPERYEVRRGATLLCPAPSAPAATCIDVVDHDLPPASTHDYTVVGRLGDHWATPPVTRSAVIAPPAPVLTLRAGDDTGTPGDGVTTVPAPTVLVQAPGGGDTYRVVVSVDGVPRDPVDVTPAGLTVEVPLDPLPPSGSSDVRASATYRDAPSTTSTLTVRVVAPMRAASLTLSDVDGRRAGGGENPFDVQGGDTATVAFSAPIDPSSVCAGWDGSTPLPVTVRVAKSDRQSVLTLGSGPEVCGGEPVSLGTITLSRGGRNDRNPLALDFPGSTLTLTSVNELVLTLGPQQRDLVWRVSGRGNPPTASFTPMATVRDIWGHLVASDPATTETTF
jgi:hypothetical protein